MKKHPPSPPSNSSFFPLDPTQPLENACLASWTRRNSPGCELCVLSRSLSSPPHLLYACVRTLLLWAARTLSGICMDGEMGTDTRIQTGGNTSYDGVEPEMRHVARPPHRIITTQTLEHASTRGYGLPLTVRPQCSNSLCISLS